MDHLPTSSPEETIASMFSYFIYGIVMSVFWQFVTKESLHFVGTLLTALFVGLIVYIANNFWFPKMFPKNKKWRFFDWLKF